ncbi:vWA domain-containing protein [Bacillus sp. FJAT-27245]|uniref:vWA domain-containing protein n=1 Tax=Bacillus sp. FJAT-27245 TaxID=1684144 RepID=UPI0006A75E2D|nr:VWA domain-containing protein [Bacillus sp. FJAT-27245]
MRRAKTVIALFFAAVLLLGCQGKDEGGAQQKKDAKEDGFVPGKAIALSQPSNGELPAITAEQYIQQDKGNIYQKYIEGKEHIDDKEALKKATADALDAYIEEVGKKNTKKWDEKKWTESITNALRAGYKDVAEELENYPVVYEKLRLPDGRLLEDLTMAEVTEDEEKKVNVVMVIDSSGSMKAKVDGEPKMALAKKSIESLAKELPESVKVSLIAFGHQGTGSDADKAKSCQAVETMYPLNAYDGTAFGNSLKKFDAMGWTPLAAGITMANEQLASQKDDNTENFIYVVSDGIETCDGDPVAAAKKAVEDNTNVKINIIGFDVDDAADQQLKLVAEAGGGEYSSVKTKRQLEEIKNVWKEKININTWRWWAIHRWADNVWTTLDHHNAVNALMGKSFRLRENEEKRFKELLDRLEKEGRIDAERKNALSKWLWDRDDKINTYFSDLDKKKSDEIKAKSEDLSKKLDAIKQQVGL